MAKTILEINELNYRVNNKTILKDFNLALSSDRIVGLLGPNGAGKTSLIRVIVGVAKRYSGTVNVNGAVDEAARKSQVSYNAPLLPDFPIDWTGTKVRDFYAGVYPDFDRVKFDEIAGYLHVVMDNALGKMSKGEIARLSIALVFSRHVALYLLDEPFEGIDSMTRKRITETIIQWKDSEATLLLSDHFLTDIANLLDEIVLIKDETVLLKVDADTVREQYGETIEEFFESKYEEGE